MSSTEPSIGTGLRTAVRVLLSGRGFFALPILVVCIFAEFIIQWATLSYEQQSAPPNVPKFPLLGVSLFGMLILILEVFKLPMAFWGASISGWRRTFCNLGIMVLCVLTWATIKDIGYNDSNAALASARQKLSEAQRLKDDHEALDRRLAALKNNDAASRESIQREIDQINSQLDRLDREAAEQVVAFDRLRSQELQSAIAPVVREQIEALESDRSAKLLQFGSEISALAQQIVEAEERNLRLVQASGDAVNARVSAWIQQCQQIDQAHAKLVEQFSRDFEVSLAAFREANQAYETRRNDYEAARKSIESDFERKRAEHEKNDAPFYDKAGKIAADRRQADAELSRLQADFESVPRPKQPERTAPSRPDYPQRPSETATVAGLIDVDGLKSQQEQLRLDRESYAQQASQAISTLREDAAAQGAEARAKIDAAVQRLRERHDQAMARIEEERIQTRRAADEATTRRNATLKDPLEIQREIASIPDEQSRMSREINRLKYEAETELTESYPGRMAQFLGYFMRDSSQEIRIQAVLTFFLPVLALIVSFAPAMVLEVVMHSLIVDREKELPKRKRRWLRGLLLGNRALRRERGVVAARALACDNRERELENEVARKVAEATDKLRQESEVARAALAESSQLVEQLLLTQKATHAETMDLLEKQRADITKLAGIILQFDASDPGKGA